MNYKTKASIRKLSIKPVLQNNGRLAEGVIVWRENTESS